MNFILLFIFINVLAAQEQMTSGITDNPLIIGGVTAEQDMFPWMVALFFEGRYICTASLISDRLVMTAAHCLKGAHDGSPEGFIGHVGSVNRSSPALKIEFESLHPHPNYSASEDGPEPDVAVLVTKETVPLGQNLLPLCLISEAGSKRPHTRRIVWAMGWGITRNSGEKKNPDILQYTWLRVLRNTRCSMKPNDSNICVGRIRKAVCFGDSGGPLVDADSKGEPVQIGIASYVLTNDQGKCRSFSSYANVGDFKNFISDIAVEHNTEVCFSDG